MRRTVLVAAMIVLSTAALAQEASPPPASPPLPQSPAPDPAPPTGPAPESMPSPGAPPQSTPFLPDRSRGRDCHHPPVISSLDAARPRVANGPAKWELYLSGERFSG